jgi:hypothetical protein
VLSTFGTLMRPPRAHNLVKNGLAACSFRVRSFRLARADLDAGESLPIKTTEDR